MTETDIVAAIKVALVRWIQGTSHADRLTEIAAPGELSVELGLLARQELIDQGYISNTISGEILSLPFLHLREIFDSDSLVGTPTDFTPVPDTVSTVIGRGAALAVHGLLQMETVSYGTENNGNLFVNLVAIPGMGTLAEKSKKSMRGHTDGVSFPFNGENDSIDERIAPSPDLVTLIGLRNPNDVPTKIIPVDAVLEHVSLEDIAELKKPQYSIRSQKTFIQGMKKILGYELIAEDQPILREINNTIEVRYSHSCVVSSLAGAAAESASNAFEMACYQAVVPIIVRPGDLLIINNRRGLHGRGEVGDEIGGQSRWLLRTYGLDTSNLSPLKRYYKQFPSYVLFP